MLASSAVLYLLSRSYAQPVFSAAAVAPEMKPSRTTRGRDPYTTISPLNLKAESERDAFVEI